MVIIKEVESQFDKEFKDWKKCIVVSSTLTTTHPNSY
jgi:hypothetical protein